MEDHHHFHQELKFVCKLCNKRYPCGKSLGGHMRSHVVPNSADFVGEEEKLHHQPSSRFGLRENPKKTWRASVGSTALVQSEEKACKQCGKVFQSLKALCGHMACHSDKDKGGGGGVNKDNDDDQSWSQIESNSDSEDQTEEKQIPRRDRSVNPKRYKKIVIKYNANNNNNNNNNSVGGSSSVSEIDFQEQEEIAKCLVMLSKDSGQWNGFVAVNNNTINNSSVVEFSDNNSVVLETTKSSSIDMKRSKKDGIFLNTPKKVEGDKKNLKSSIDMVQENSHSSDSEYFLGENKGESEISVNRIRGTYYDYGYDDSALASRKSGKQKRTYNNDTSYDPNRDSREYKKGKIVSSLGANKKKYECLNCKKCFTSYQALGGHRPCHKKINADRESGYGTGENSLEGDDAIRERLVGKRGNAVKDSSPEKSVKFKKVKGHECPFCNRVFKSGQALGGHKRSHFLGGSSQVINASNHASPSAKTEEEDGEEEEEEAPDLLDLNLPAPVEDNEDEPLMSW
ncbi:unnamed protein product [Cuscuta campestris]|uniref:C2H2-type domain-containing protein n=1 Tax=Cuscuta campestris TaxID=132261 RepID=A0A484L3X8_9ASTE|nr:unnamed protein product [Cuscuta campestris]